MLGVDPGTHHCGWGIVAREGTRFIHIAHGVIHAPSKEAMPERLCVIADAMKLVLAEHKPAGVGMEQAFVHLDPKAALAIGHARGAIMVECVRAGLPVSEYAPTVVKRAVVGSGKADKTQVNSMIRVLLGLSEAPPLDASDALAVAICHSSAAQFATALAEAGATQNPAQAMLAQLWKPKGKSSGRGRFTR